MLRRRARTTKKMLDPYENIMIGNFLYSLGARSAFRCAQLGIEFQGAICLLQQTPLDGEGGDVSTGG